MSISPSAPIQRGYYLTAFNEATKRVDEKQDPKAMTLLAELYANGFGVKQDDAKAAEWYRLAADRGDREAMFALAMFRHRRTRRRRKAATRPRKLLASAAKLGHVAAAYDLGAPLYRGSAIPAGLRARRRIAPPGRECRQSGSAIRARDLLQGGPRRTEGRARGREARSARPRSPAISTRMTEYSIALYNGTGVAKDEAAAAAILLQKAARRGSPIAQNRLARVFATGRGLPADPVEAIKWHLISKAGRRHRPLPRRIRRESSRRGARSRRESRQAVARDHRGVAILTARALDAVLAAGAHQRPNHSSRKHRNRHMAKINGNEIRPGMVIEYQDTLWVAVKTMAVKPGKGPAYNQVELKNLIDGRKLNNRFGSDERVERVRLEQKDFQFLYKQGEAWCSWTTKTTSSSNCTKNSSASAPPSCRTA